MTDLKPGWNRYRLAGGAVVAAALITLIDKDAGNSDEAVLTLDDGAQVVIALHKVTDQHPNEGPFVIVRDEGGDHQLQLASAFQGEHIPDPTPAAPTETTTASASDGETAAADTGQHTDAPPAGDPAPTDGQSGQAGDGASGADTAAGAQA